MNKWWMQYKLVSYLQSEQALMFYTPTFPSCFNSPPPSRSCYLIVSAVAASPSPNSPSSIFLAVLLSPFHMHLPLHPLTSTDLTVFLCTRIHFNLAFDEERRRWGQSEAWKKTMVWRWVRRWWEKERPEDQQIGEVEQQDEKRLVGGHSQHEGGEKEWAFLAWKKKCVCVCRAVTDSGCAFHKNLTRKKKNLLVLMREAH